MFTICCPRKLKLLLSKRQSMLVVKAAVLVSVFSLYFLVLIKESMNVMESKTKTVNALKVDNSKLKHQTHRHITQASNHFTTTATKSESREKSRKNHTLKPPSFYLIPDPKFHPKETSHRDDGDTTPQSSSSHLSKTPQSTTLNPVYEYSEEINAQAEHDFNERRKHLWDVCEHNKITGKLTPNAWEFFISPGHGLTWCNVFKAASSTWMYYFNILAGYDLKYLQRTIATPLDLARKRFPRPNLEDLNEAMENSISFLVVREPFERILSAYRNKFEHGRNTYYKLLGDQIVKKFRVMTTNRDPLAGPTFSEFLQFVVQHYKSGGRFDEHWSPIYQFCTPCSINFTLIAKMETFQRDTEYIIRQAGLETLLLDKVPKGKERKITNRSASDSKHLIPKYFSKIDIVLLQEVLDIYQVDFDLFGYESSKYFRLVQPKKLAGVDSRLDVNNDAKTKSLAFS